MQCASLHLLSAPAHLMKSFEANRWLREKTAFALRSVDVRSIPSRGVAKTLKIVFVLGARQ